MFDLSHCLTKRATSCHKINSWVIVFPENWNRPAVYTSLKVNICSDRQLWCLRNSFVCINATTFTEYPSFWTQTTQAEVDYTFWSTFLLSFIMTWNDPKIEYSGKGGVRSVIAQQPRTLPCTWQPGFDSPAPHMVSWEPPRMIPEHRQE